MMINHDSNHWFMGFPQNFNSYHILRSRRFPGVKPEAEYPLGTCSHDNQHRDFPAQVMVDDMGSGFFYHFQEL